jgi:hypothetical protein
LLISICLSLISLPNDLTPGKGCPASGYKNSHKLSLLDERAGRFGFRDLAGARQIAKLLADGVRLSEIIRSVTEIRKWLPEVGLGSVRLHPGPRDSLEVERAGARTDKRGQFMLAVDDCVHDPDDLFANAQAAEQAGDIAEAERFYRMLMKGNNPSVAFNLGNMLRPCGRNVEAKAALHAAIRIDPAFAEAWYNLGDLLDDQGRSEAAVESLHNAVQVARDASSTCLYCCNETISVQRRQITGGAISLSTDGPKGLAAHADHSNSARCSSI